MRQVVNGKRTRGRPGRNRPSNPRNQTYDSNGPEGRVRGSASQVFEKYLALARDAQSAGDRIGAENFFQHAEHYYRILNVNSQSDRDRVQGNGSGQGGVRVEQNTGHDGGNPVDSAVTQPQPQPMSQPQPQPQPMSQPLADPTDAGVRAPEAKTARRRKPASNSGDSPKASSAESAET